MNEELMGKILQMKALQKRMDNGKELLATLQKEYDQLRLHDIPNAMSEMDTSSIKGEWGRCTLTGDLTIKVKEKEELHKWLKDNNFADLIVPQVNAMTLKAWVKEQLISGGGVIPVPEQIIVISPFSRAVLYKS